MGFTDDVRQALIQRIGPGKRYPNNKRMADELGVDPSQLNRFLKKERGLNSESLGHILDRVGVTISFSDDPVDASREIAFVQPQPLRTDSTAAPKSDDYLAVPLIDLPTATHTGQISEDVVNGWLLVWRHQESFQNRHNLVAVEMGCSEPAMAPTIHAGDIIIVDRDDRVAEPAGKIMLVRDPEKETTNIRRVCSRTVDEDCELIFYADNSREYPPSTFRVERDYGGDMTRAIGGTVVWAWSDMSRK